MTDLQTFDLPESIEGAASDRSLAREMIRAWQTDGILQTAMTPEQNRTTADAVALSRRFFGMPLQDKAACVSDLTYSGYIASARRSRPGRRTIRRSSPCARTST